MGVLKVSKHFGFRLIFLGTDQLPTRKRESNETKRSQRGMDQILERPSPTSDKTTCICNYKETLRYVKKKDS
jgi:hypothetical protein